MAADMVRYDVIRRSSAPVALLLAAAAASPLAAQDEPAPPPLVEAEPALRFTLTPGAWVPRLTGDGRLAGPAIDFKDDIDLRSREATFNGELEMRKDDRWHVHFNWYDFDTSNSGSYMGGPADFGSLLLQPGDAYRARVEITSFAAEVGYAWLHRYTEVSHADLRVGPVFAVRYVDVDQRLEQVGVGEELTGGEWLAPMVGINFELMHEMPDGFPLLQRIEVQAIAAAGPALGGDGGSIAHVRVGAHFFLTDSLAFDFGFRLLEVNAESNDFYEMSGGLQGLFIGGSIRF